MSDDSYDSRDASDSDSMLDNEIVSDRIRLPQGRGKTSKLPKKWRREVYDSDFEDFNKLKLPKGKGRAP